MADFADEAHQNEERARELALAQHADRQRRRAGPRLQRKPEEAGLCDDCDEPIEPARLRLLNDCSRCAACAHAHEQRMNAKYGY